MSLVTVVSTGGLQFQRPGIGPGQATQLSPIVTAGLGLVANVASNVIGEIFEEGSSGADVIAMATGNGCGPKCPPGFVWSLKQRCCVKSRRRRKRMLTCSDKSDIAFLTATLGKGEMAKSAIGSLLANCR